MTRALTALIAAAALATPAPSIPPIPATPKRPVVDEHHGVKVTDDYRWLENWSDPEVQKWSEEENARARALLDAIPFRPEVEKRLSELLEWESPSYGDLQYHGGRAFAFKMQPPRQQPTIVYLPSLDDTSKEKVLVDPNAIDPSGGTSIDFYRASPDGKYVAASLSKGGTESGDVHVYEVDTGKALADVVPRANSGTAGGSLAWAKGSAGFWYTRHPAKGEVKDEDLGFFQQVWFHKLGTPSAQDTYSIGKDFPRIAESFLASSEDGAWVVDFVQKGDGGEYEVFLLDAAKNAWTKVAGYDEQLKFGEFGFDGGLYVMSVKGAERGKLLRIPLDAPAMDKAKLVVPQGKFAIEALVVTPQRLYLTEQTGGPEQLRVLDLQGKQLALVPTLPVSAVRGAVRLAGDDAAYMNAGFLNPMAWYRYEAATGKVAKTALAQTAPVDLSYCEVLREEAKSKDGTKVPLTIVKPKKAKRDGKNPTLLYGYGGYGINMTPGYIKQLPAWLEQGGIYVQAVTRGGGEFGESWHKAGYRTNKQHVFDDFIAVAQHLVARKYTSPRKLGIYGGSNGGLLMGAAETQAPQLFAAVAAAVGIFDMLRYEQTPNGVFNVTEYGSVKDPEQFKALLAYSPYQHVKEGVKYPPALFLTGANDPRVDPMNSRKMVARLQAVGAEALLRTSGSTGHVGVPLKERIDQATDLYAFMMEHLGMKYRAPAEAGKTGTGGAGAVKKSP